MIHEKITLWENREDVFLVSYRIENPTQYRQNARRPAILICPGGAFRFISEREGEPLALAFATRGYHAFVLHYTVNAAFPACLLDAAKAMQTIRDHAGEWFIDPEQIVIEGTSAGGYLASALPALSHTDIFRDIPGLDPKKICPNAAIIGYGAIDQSIQFEMPYLDQMNEERRGFVEELNKMLYGTWPASQEIMDRYNPLAHITEAMPPVFVWTTFEDSIVPPMNALRMMEELERRKIPVEGHFFGWAPHAMSLATLAIKRGNNVDPHIAKWFDLADEWLIHTFGLDLESKV